MTMSDLDLQSSGIHTSEEPEESREHRMSIESDLQLNVSPQRQIGEVDCTGIFVRAQFPDGHFGSVDIAQLDRASLHRWLRSRGGKNLWAENCVIAMLGWEQIAEDEQP